MKIVDFRPRRHSKSLTSIFDYAMKERSALAAEEMMEKYTMMQEAGYGTVATSVLSALALNSDFMNGMLTASASGVIVTKVEINSATGEASFHVMGGIESIISKEIMVQKDTQ